LCNLSHFNHLLELSKEKIKVPSQPSLVSST
jgi:hypothetical protein